MPPHHIRVIAPRTGLARALRARLADGAWHSETELAGVGMLHVAPEIATRYAVRIGLPARGDRLRYLADAEWAYIRHQLGQMFGVLRERTPGGWRYRVLQRPCPGCGAPFAPTKNSHRVCSKRCQMRVARQGRAPTQSAAPT